GDPVARSALLPTLLLSLAAAALAAEEGASTSSLFPPCPVGTVRKGAAPPDGTKAWCENADGKKHGLYRIFGRDGTPSYEARYENGRKLGWSRSWNRDGELVREVEYSGNRIVARRRLGAEAVAARSRPSDPVHPCPNGAVVAGSAGDEQWCEKRRADGAYVRHGPWIRWSSEDRVRERGTYSDGERNRAWVEYWPNGNVKSETAYVDGTRHGLSTHYFEVGGKSSEKEWVHGRSAGRHLRWYASGNPRSDELQDERRELLRRSVWYENGQKKQEIHWTEPRKTGTTREWWPSGLPKEEGEWRDGQKFGRWRYWNSDGQLLRIATHVPGEVIREEVFVVYSYDDPDWMPRPVPRGDDRAPIEPLTCPKGTRKVEEEAKIGLGWMLAALDDSGGHDAWDLVMLKAMNLIRFPVSRREACVAGSLPPRKQGPAVERTLKGVRTADGAYRDGRKEGLWLHWDYGGRKSGEVLYRDGQPIREVSWHTNGNTLSVRRFEDGGDVFSEWYPNGALRLVGGHRHGEPHGPWMWHLETGFRYEQGEYKDGGKHGLWVHWKHHGHRDKEQEFRDGKAHGRYVELRPDGTPHVQGSYRDGERHGTWTKWRFEHKESEVHWQKGLRHGPTRSRSSPRASTSGARIPPSSRWHASRAAAGSTRARARAARRGSGHTGVPTAPCTAPTISTRSRTRDRRGTPPAPGSKSILRSARTSRV
ncbi:MAG: toxin-antitoxin system YwqK family antitoxin, partial [Planctomycetota bacterium]